ncbi:Phage terminase large subunit (GpA) [Symmachiella macrocystis]|uniref:Phage terminase large subunit (GpA) n=1 Tax=Symmachiella macrocystis TaxID=2527985 RepID=A0A5C6BMD2_9PLAN|nr:terminase gpA endonuclease subunit [Symmachiella macrocystis]TWU12867.1 Phage terminase large subunit (GpA) [Symmachiella macrocystis]
MTIDGRELVDGLSPAELAELVQNAEPGELAKIEAALVEGENKPQPAASVSARRKGKGWTGYDRTKADAAKRSADNSRAGRDIGELPAVVDPQRRAAAARSFRVYLEVYFPDLFYMGWSADHLRVISKIERAVLEGGLFAMAMPRGSGKTSLAECACLWAMSYGWREFVALIGADEKHAADMLASIKVELETNENLLADFPEVCYPIRMLEGIAHRCRGQLHLGRRTQMQWTAREIVLPTIADSAASGAVVKVAGLTGGIRGMKFKRADGRAVRPSLVVLDDPQTDESAKSPSQCRTREEIVAGAVLGLAGPGNKISGVMPCTVIREGDLADAMLDTQKRPEWQGERTKLVYAFPENEKLWEQYEKIRADGLRAGDGGAAGTEFYRANREAMDAGSKVAWEERFLPGELSAIQSAMNLKIDNEAAFFAEYQNEPLPTDDVDDELLSEDEICRRINRGKRGAVPAWASRLSVFVDVHKKLLYWMVCAWGNDFTGAVIDYGAYPDQKRARFTLRESKVAMSHKAPGAGMEGAIYAGLEVTVDDLLGREWAGADGAALRPDICLIDANWGQSTDVIKMFCRQSHYAGQLWPSHGKGVTASMKPLGEWRNEPGDLAGLNWRAPTIRGKRGAVRHVMFDANFWKSFLNARLSTSMGDPGALTLFGNKPERHALLADHLTAEYRIRTEGRGRRVDEWKVKPGRADNHWLDCGVGCAVGASMLGVELMKQVGSGAGKAEPRKRKRRRVSYL